MIKSGWLVGLALAMCSGLALSAESMRYHGFQGEGAGYVPHLDARAARLAPSAAQQAAAQALGATVRWNRHGTPKSLIRYGGFLSASSNLRPEGIARQFLKSQATLFGLAAAAVDNMETLRVSPLYESPDYARMLRGEEPATSQVPHVVLLRQTFDGLVTGGREGLVTVGVSRDGRVAYVGSTLTRESALNGTATLSEIQALQRAAADVGMNLGELTALSTPLDDFSTYASSILDDVQRVRLRALPTVDAGLRRVYEVTLLDTSHERGHPQAFIIHLDAQTGQVWIRDNAVQHFSDTPHAQAKAPAFGQFQGMTPAPAVCSDPHNFIVEGTDNGVIQVTATGTTLVEDGAVGLPQEPVDITLELYYEGQLVATQDVLGSPEALAYAPGGGVQPGSYDILVCPFDPANTPAFEYAGVYSATAGASAETTLPVWRVFPLQPNPPVGVAGVGDPGEDIRELWCWQINDGDPLDDGDLGRPAEDCQGPELRNIASRVPWDALADGTATFTTHGNNASTSISNASFITPDTVVLRPVSEDRSYDFAWNNAWYESQCNPLTYLDPTQNLNDYEAATANLFAMHNRMHDWSYLLGFTEVNSNLQFDNFGLTSPARENDGELGSSQAGRLTINGRDNANQLTLQDGVPGVTNQYLWQPLKAIFYPACVDGAYDMAIIGHEYTHATSNRMTGGPDGALGGGHAGNMGEAWSDLAAIEFQIAQDLVPDSLPNKFGVAAFATGDPVAGIRNYAINQSPLNFSNFEYDGNGTTSPHADSEIWGATNYRVRQALIEKYDASHPSDDMALQAACANGQKDSADCPGNRRWVQLLFDGLLLQPAGPSMLDARDAILAADVLRYGGENQPELWDGFAASGMGEFAFTLDANDLNPRPDFSSPERDDEAVVRFAADGDDGQTPVFRIYVGQYEARVTPVADNDSATPAIDDLAAFVPGSYDFLVQAEGYGAHRFTVDLVAGTSGEIRFPLRANLASTHRGASASGDGDAPAELTELIDDTEATNWQSTDPAGTASEGKGEGAFVEGRQVTVELAERSEVVEVNVSAALTPEGQNRFTALRSFDLLACDADSADCATDAGFSTIHSSADDAFPAVRPRPRAPELRLRSFDVDDVTATHLRIVVRDNQCTGGPEFQLDTNPSMDPGNNPDCDTGSNAQLTALALPDAPGTPELEVRIAELQVFATAKSDPVGIPGELPDPTPVDPTPDPMPETANPLVRTGKGGAPSWLLLLAAGALLRRRR